MDLAQPLILASLPVVDSMLRKTMIGSMVSDIYDANLNKSSNSSYFDWTLYL